MYRVSQKFICTLTFSYDEKNLPHLCENLASLNIPLVEWIPNCTESQALTRPATIFEVFYAQNLYTRIFCKYDDISS